MARTLEKHPPRFEVKQDVIVIDGDIEFEGMVRIYPKWSAVSGWWYEVYSDRHDGVWAVPEANLR